ncbi:site-2 protease family protein [Clostridium grantii]|uniref:Zn-dependent protease (Includes SpoIVFB) n=1 Tax=Clostridium grantii DSM 8605 TaxID=1121316 RepID=A0A1M5XAL2_9CLOT|nr:site-2 protease family protein [Clostridium grantii]SHH96841.1 Zn-dependent protease (includes SpoIVFB) [Clostridium grantii DSM 8605]
MELLQTVYLLPGILIGFTFHEFAHARMAVWLGDETPRFQGRLSLNPFVHMDIFGLLLIILAGFGWAKPVQVNPDNFNNKRRDHILVSLAGPLMNLLIAISFLIIMKIAYLMPQSVMNSNLHEVIMNFLSYGVWINIVLFVFNLLPVPPLDGAHIFSDIFNLKETNFNSTLNNLTRFLLPILIITSALDLIIMPPIIAIYNFLLGIFF